MALSDLVGDKQVNVSRPGNCSIHTEPRGVASKNINFAARALPVFAGMSRMGDDADGRKIFVGGLPFSADEHAIREDFGKFGEIEDVYLPRDKELDRPRGFGFVTYKDARDAEDAAKDLNG
eukprot:scaffold94445_cov63-Phaeocystis_antarctica.AAC.2